MNKKTGDKLAQVAATIGIAISLVAIVCNSGKAEAADTAGTGKIRLAATLHQSPAMQAVTWSIVRNKAEVRTSKSHSWTLDLIPGIYEVKLSCNGKDLQRIVSVLADGISDVSIACD